MPPATPTASAPWCWAASSAAGWSPARPRRCDRRRQRGPRGRAGRAHRHRRGRAALPPVRRRRSPRAASSSTSTSPAPTPPSPGGRARGPGRDGPASGQGAPGRGRPGHPGARVGHPCRDRLRGGAGIPYGQGFVKNAYVGPDLHPADPDAAPARHPAQAQPARDVIRGKRLVVVDDSIVRGNTQRAQIRMLREAGAAEVHVRISSPPVKWPCFYGIDFATRAELIANGPQGRGDPGAHRRRPLGLHLARRACSRRPSQPPDRLCAACFTGQYPIELPEDGLIGKHFLETLPTRSGPATTRASTSSPSTLTALPRVGGVSERPSALSTLHPVVHSRVARRFDDGRRVHRSRVSPRRRSAALMARAQEPCRGARRRDIRRRELAALGVDRFAVRDMVSAGRWRVLGRADRMRPHR